MDLVKAFGKYLRGLTCVACIGGTKYEDDDEKLNVGAHVIVGTVGRVSTMMLTKDFIARSIRTLVLDEGDKIVTDGSFRHGLQVV